MIRVTGHNSLHVLLKPNIYLICKENIVLGFNSKILSASLVRSWFQILEYVGNLGETQDEETKEAQREKILSLLDKF